MPIPSRRIPRTVLVAALLAAAFTGLGAAPAGAPAWRVDGPGGGFFPVALFAPSDASRVYVTTPWGGIFRSDDGGESYERLPADLKGATLVSTSVNPADRDHLLAVACNNLCSRIVRSLDGGLTWEDVYTVVDGTFIARFGAGAAFVAPEYGLVRSDDGGATWSPSGLEGLRVSGLWFDRRRPSLAIAMSTEPVTLWRSEDSGRSWAPMPTPPHWTEFYNLLFDPGRPGVVYGIANQRAVRSTDDGRTWRRMLPAASLRVLGDGTVLVSWDNGLLRSTDGGQTFTPAPGKPGAVRLDDEIGGISVSPAPHPHRALVGGSLGLWRTDDSGRSWQPASGLAAHDVYTLRASAGGEPRVYAIADYAIFARKGGPGGWRKVHPGPHPVGAALRMWDLRGLEADPADSLHLVAFNYLELLESRNGGRSWRSFPPAGLSLGYLEVTGLAVDWSTGAIYAAALELVTGPHDPPPYPRLAVTRDGGATWERLRPFARRNWKELSLSLAVDPRDSSVLWGKTTEAGLYRSGDRGHTWARIGYGLPEIPRRFNENRAAFAFDPDDPQRMIAAVPGRGVWQSADGGRSFRRLGQGLETAVIPTLAHATDPATGRRFWLAGASPQGIFRLAGERWTPVGTFAEPIQFTGTFTFDPVDPSVLYAGTFTRSVLRLDLRER